MPEPYRMTQEQVAVLRSHQAHINAAKENIARLKRIGIDVTELENDLNTAIQYRDGLLQHFGPTKPVTP
jgi:hypothetical protein